MRLLIKDILQKTTQFFRDKGIESARLDTELLLAYALKWERMKLYLNYEYPLSDEELNACRELVKRRASGEPIAYILGRRDFFKNTFEVSPAVLIPRPETETLVEETLNWLNQETENARVIDLGTGSGCIGLSLLAERPELQLIAVDISAVAIEVARRNADTLGVSERAHFFATDAVEFSAEKTKSIFGALADAVVSNPPYISNQDPRVQESVRKFEPSQALFSGDDGLDAIRSWAEKASELVRIDGLVIFEIGDFQGREASEIFETTGRYRDVSIVKDLTGRERFVRAIRAGGN